MKKKVVPNTGKNAGKEIEVNKYYYSSKDKPVAVIMGCFSPFTGKKGHGKQLETAINSGIDEFVLAIVPKKEKIDSDRNMFTLEQKKDIAEEAIKSLGYKLIDSFIAQKSFGASILKEVAERHPDRRIVLICGPDREDEYSKFCRKYDPKNSQKPGLEKDDYEYHPHAKTLLGKKSRVCFRLGDAVRIRVSRVNVEERLIDFDFISFLEQE